MLGDEVVLEARRSDVRKACWPSTVRTIFRVHIAVFLGYQGVARMLETAQENGPSLHGVQVAMSEEEQRSILRGQPALADPRHLEEERA